MIGNMQIIFDFKNLKEYISSYEFEEIDDKKLKRAGLDYWHMLDITYYDSLDDFLEKHKEENDKFSYVIN